MSRNFDYGPYAKRGQMAKDALREMQRDASQLESALQEDDVLPGWVDLYINTSGDRLHVASQYMQNRIRHFDPSAQSYGDAGLEASIDQLHQKLASGDGQVQEQSKFLGLTPKLALAWAATMPIAALVSMSKGDSTGKVIASSLFSVPYLATEVAKLWKK